MAIKIEEIGLEFYKIAGRNSKSPEMKELFDYLAREEIKHKKIFESLKETAVESAQGVPIDWDEVDLYIQAMVEDSMFIGDDKGIASSVFATDEKEAVSHALQFEKETLLYFYQISELVKPGDRPAVHKIIEEEKKHIRRLIKIKKKIS